MKLILVAEAQSELVDAIIHYESVQQGLGRSLRDEISAKLIWIQANPELLRLRPSRHRRVNLRIFPYYIPYLIRDDVVWVLAIAHARRKPLYWIRRRLAG